MNILKIIPNINKILFSKFRIQNIPTKIKNKYIMSSTTFSKFKIVAIKRDLSLKWTLYIFSSKN